MNNLISKFFIVFSAVIFLSSCQPTKIFYNERLAQDYAWTDRDLEKLQFYVSEDIVLQRELRRGEAILQGGQLKRTQGRQIEQVIIKRGTPGTYLFSTTDGNYAITFDGKNNKNFLIFGPSQVRGRYALRAKKWERNYGVVTYGGQEYTTAARSSQAFLLISSKGNTTTRVSRKTERGSRVQ